MVAKLRTQYLGCRILEQTAISQRLPSCRALTTASMTATTGKALLAASNKTKPEALTRAEISAGRTAIRTVDLTKARLAILGRIKTRIRTVGIATVQTAKTAAKETVTQPGSEAARQPIDGHTPALPWSIVTTWAVLLPWRAPSAFGFASVGACSRDKRSRPRGQTGHTGNGVRWAVRPRS